MAESDNESSTSGEEERKGEYEKQRLSRIAENKARLEALGISKSAKALLGHSPVSRKRRPKRHSAGKEDDDYRPGEADGDEDDDDVEDAEFLGNSTCVSRKRKLRNKASSSKRKVLSKKNTNILDSLGDEQTDDDDLKKAIALSLQESVAASSGTPSSKKRRNNEDAGSWKKKKPEVMSRKQMTEDEIVIYFYQFDEAGKGFITFRDLAKMATVHDFTWTEEELQDMIRCFDIDKDRKLSLDEFRKIVTRCRMLKEP